MCGQTKNGSTTSPTDFDLNFKNKYSSHFDPTLHLQKVGVINQTTMLADETQEISAFFRELMIQKYGIEQLKNHFADTRDTLCYATNDNQTATKALLKENLDLVLVIGGYNSSNTSHIVELFEPLCPTYFISRATDILSATLIQHFDLHQHQIKKTENFLPIAKSPLKIAITAGASCPDSIVEEVILKIRSLL